MFPYMTEQGQSFYDREYYETGPASGKSNYESYQWMPDQTHSMCSYMMRFMGMKRGDSAYDVGCAKGFVVKSLRMMNVDATGYDISEYAIANCDPGVKGYVSNEFKADPMSRDFVIMKDVAEHIDPEELRPMLVKLMASARKAMMIIVPLTGVDDGEYLCPKDEGDASHKVRWTISTWLKFLSEVDRRIIVSGSLYVPEIKQSNTAWEGSCGFFLLRRF